MSETFLCLERLLADMVSQTSPAGAAAVFKNLLVSLIAQRMMKARQRFLTNNATRIRDDVMRVHAWDDSVQSVAMQFISLLAHERRHRHLQLLFVEDVRSILVHPLLYGRDSVAEALRLFKVNGAKALLKSVCALGGAQLFIDLISLFAFRGDEEVVASALRAAGAALRLHITTLSLVGRHSAFLMTLFHKSDRLRRDVFLYIFTAAHLHLHLLPQSLPSKTALTKKAQKKRNKREAENVEATVQRLVPYMTVADAEYMRERGCPAVKRMFTVLFDAL